MSHENGTVGNNGLQQYRREELSQKNSSGQAANGFPPRLGPGNLNDPQIPIGRQEACSEPCNQRSGQYQPEIGGEHNQPEAYDDQYKTGVVSTRRVRNSACSTSEK